MDLEVTMLEDVPGPSHDEDAEDTLPDFQDAVLMVHQITMQIIADKNVAKIIENPTECS